MWNKIKAAFAEWYHWRYVAPFTVACDLSLFAYPMNTQERLFQFNGIAKARRFARCWVAIHPSGQARILAGHLSWENKNV